MVHIPISESKDIDILSFEESRKTRENSLSYNQDKWIYYPNFYSEYRYILGTVGNKPIIVIGINPSTAEPDNIDNTIKSVERLALKNGYDSYIMCNVYAQRATEPNAMDEFFNYKLHQENIKAFRWIFNRVKGNPTIWAAWGTNIKRRSYLEDCLKEIVNLSEEFDSIWLKAGNLLKKGHPHHHLYLSNNTVFDFFDIDSYILNL